MRIEEEKKLAFRDVLIKPKRSTLKSRSEVSLDRTYKFRNAEASWTGVPIMAANMDSVATFEMAEALAGHKCFTCIHKHYSVEEWLAWTSSPGAAAAIPYVAISCGTSDADYVKVKEVIAKSKISYVCADVANGYSEHFVEFIRKARAELPKHVVIIAGNVCSPEMTEELILTGADIVKIGIGPGSACKTR
jgi:GMP reductase